MHQPNPNPLSPDEALNRLKEGHQRFLEGRPLRPHASRERLRDLAESQWPMAAVLGCADSRVPVELLDPSEDGGEIPTGKTIADLDRATRRNALLNLRRLSEDSPLIAARVQEGSLRLVAAHYDLDDHCLEWLVEV